MNKFVEQVAKIDAEHLEKFAAAFLKEVGSSKASEYTLVRRTDGAEVAWRFRHQSVCRGPFPNTDYEPYETMLKDAPMKEITRRNPFIQVGICHPGLTQTGGETLRDKLADSVLFNLIGGDDDIGQPGSAKNRALCTKAYGLADDMLEERSKYAD